MPYQSLRGASFASRIDDKHWQAGYPAQPEKLRAAGFDVIVLAAEELQPDARESRDFAGVEIIYAPMEDDYDNDVSVEQVGTATEAANQALQRLYAGKRVLVTCAAGRNRSGLISALMLMARRGISGEEAAKWVQGARAFALTNPRFVAFLNKLPVPGSTVSIDVD